MEISTLGGFWFLQSPVRCLGVNALKTALGEVLADSAEKAAPNREGPRRQGRGSHREGSASISMEGSDDAQDWTQIFPSMTGRKLSSLWQ